MLTDPAAHVPVLVPNRLRLRLQSLDERVLREAGLGHTSHAFQGPGQVHGRGPRPREPIAPRSHRSTQSRRVGLLVRGPGQRRDAESGGDSDQRGSTDAKGLDGLEDVLQAAQLEFHRLAGQARLIEDDEAGPIVGPANGLRM